MTKWAKYRDLTLLFGGISLVFNECLIQSQDHPTILVLGAAMMGLPAFMRPQEERDRSRGYKKVDTDKPIKLSRNTDLRIVGRLPEHPTERAVRKEMKQLAKYESTAKLVR